MVKELLFHFALQEGFNCLLEIRLIALVDKEVEFMAVVVREIPIFLVSTQSVPLFNKVEGTKFASVGPLDLPDFAKDLRHFGQVVYDLHLSRGDIFDEVRLLLV